MRKRDPCHFPNGRFQPDLKQQQDHAGLRDHVERRIGFQVLEA